MSKTVTKKETFQINTDLIYQLTSLFWTKEEFEIQLSNFCQHLGAFHQADQVRLCWVEPYFKTINSWSVNKSIKNNYGDEIDVRCLDQTFFSRVKKAGFYLDEGGVNQIESLKNKDKNSKNLLLLPVIFDSNHWGYLSLEYYKGHKKFNTSEIETLKSIKDFFNAIVSKQYVLNELRQQKNHFEVLATSVDEGMLVIKDGKVIDANQTAISMFGFNLEEFKNLKRGVDDIIESGYSWVTDTITDLNNNVYETKGVNSEKQVFPIELKGKKIINNLQAIFVLTIKDISLLRRFEKELRESERRWQFAVDGSGLGLWDWDAVSNEVFFSKQWKHMLGFKDHEIYGSLEEWDRRVHPNDKERVYADLNRHFEGETEHYINEHRVLCKDGSYKWILDRGKVMSWTPEGKPKRVIGTHYDITERKESLFQLNKLNATKDKLFSIISHDLRGPIWAMIQLCELFDRDQFESEEERMGYIKSLKELSINTYDLLENLLNWARVNQDEIQFQPKEIDLLEIINKNIDQNEYQLNAKKLKTVISMEEGQKAFADYHMINLCVRNILGNAIKFSKEEGLIQFTLKEKNNELFVEIKNNGVGIKQEDIDKILSDSQYHSTWGTSNEKGAGLGMKLCKSFVNKCKGVLYITSEENDGTTFGFTLPINK